MKVKYLLVAIMSVFFMPMNAIQYVKTDTVAVSIEDIDILESDTVASDTIVLDQNVIFEEKIAEAVKCISESYPKEWTELSMQGKLSFEGLPVRPTVKIYMKRGESILVSARAPILGEVARVEICNDSITIINKHTRKYWTQPLASYTKANPDIMSDIQDIFLGKVAFPGRGRLTPELAVMSNWLATSAGEVFLFPIDELQFVGSEFGFILDSEDYGMLSFVMMLLKSDVVMQTTYLYGEAGWTLGLNMEAKGNKIGGELQLSYPDYNPTPLGFTNAGERYNRTDIKGILKF